MADYDFLKHKRPSDVFTEDGSDESRSEYSSGDEHNDLPSPPSAEQEMKLSRAHYTRAARDVADFYQECIDNCIIAEYNLSVTHDQEQKLVAGKRANAVEERERDFSVLLDRMQEEGLPTAEAEAIVDRARAEVDRSSSSKSMREGTAKSRPGAQFMCFIFLLLVCCIWMGCVMAIRDGKLTWQMMWEIQMWLQAWVGSEVGNRLRLAKEFFGRSWAKMTGV